MSAFSAFLTELGDSLGELFTRSPSRAVVILADLMEAAAFSQQVTSELGAMLHALSQKWQADMETLTSDITTGCPSWQVARGSLMDREQTKLVLTLVKNPSYPRLGEWASTLQEHVACVKHVHRDGGAPMISAEITKAASDAVSLAIDTVVVTNVLFRIRVELVRIVNVNAKRDAAKEMLELITTKRTDVGEDIMKELRALASGAAREATPASATPKTAEHASGSAGDA